MVDEVKTVSQCLGRTFCVSFNVDVKIAVTDNPKFLNAVLKLVTWKKEFSEEIKASDDNNSRIEDQKNEFSGILF